MPKRELTDAQKIILEEIPTFFQWHEGCQKQVESLIENQVDVRNQVEKLNKQVRDENWSMVEIHAENLKHLLLEK